MSQIPAKVAHDFRRASLCACARVCECMWDIWDKWDSLREPPAFESQMSQMRAFLSQIMATPPAAMAAADHLSA